MKAQSALSREIRTQEIIKREAAKKRTRNGELFIMMRTSARNSIRNLAEAKVLLHRMGMLM